MDWKVFGTAFLTLFLAELGDKTQLAIITMTAKGESKWAIFFGASLAFRRTFIAIRPDRMASTHCRRRVHRDRNSDALGKVVK
jgi:putative Ca2+/H+ antiporter (TMEM165/GDT1 family)